MFCISVTVYVFISNYTDLKQKLLQSEFFKTRLSKLPQVVVISRNNTKCFLYEGQTFLGKASIKMLIKLSLMKFMFSK